MARQFMQTPVNARQKIANDLEKVKNSRWQPLYDSRLMVTSSAQSYEYFRSPVGSTEDGAVKTISETNNTVAGQIPNSSSMDVYGIRIGLKATTPIISADFRAILTNSRGYLQFFVRKDIVLEVPLFVIPSGFGLVTNQLAVAGDSTTNGIPDARNSFNLLPYKVLIPELTPFSVKVTFDTMGAIVGSVKLFVFLDGVLKEPVYK